MNLSSAFKNLEKEISSFKTRNSVDPIVNFHRKVTEFVSLVDFVESKAKSRLVKLNARKNYVINLVTAAEVYFKDLVKILPEFKKVKINWKSISELLDGKIEKMSIVEAFQLSKRKELKIGDLIAVNNKFENLENIDIVFSKILGINFLKEIEFHRHKLSKVEAEFFTVTSLCLICNLPDWKNQVGKLFNKRHEIVHQVCFNDNLTYKEISDFWWRLVCFVYAVDFFVRDKYL